LTAADRGSHQPAGDPLKAVSSSIVAAPAVPEGATRVGRLNANRCIEFTVVFAPATAIPAKPLASSAKRPSAGSNSRTPPHLTHAELWRRHGAPARCTRLVESFAGAFGLEIVDTAPHRRNFRLCGSAASVGRAFKTSFDQFELDGERFFAAATPPTIPPEWAGLVEAMFGLESSPHARPSRRCLLRAQGTPAPFQVLAEAYKFPHGFDGTGETIAVIEFGGGFRSEDIAQFCARAGVAPPRITVVETGGGANRPASRRAVGHFLDVASGALPLTASEQQSAAFQAAQCTAEVTMDLEIVAALAPGAHIVVSFSSGDQRGLFHAIDRAVHDRAHRPSILSISWSFPEQALSLAELHAIEGVLREAAHLGITVCASSGDSGALNGSTDGEPSVNYPASSPSCLACGGTSARLNSQGMGEEVVWNATHHGISGASGGGVSQRFPVPAWQADARVPLGPKRRAGRGVPDVAALADPAEGCELLIGGRVFRSNGTSAAAVLWAALVARLNQALGRRCGHLHAHLYRLGKVRAGALGPVLQGDNGFYKAGKGWNACTGYGTPRGADLLAHLQHRLKR
jgi:kumamolisin